MDTTQNTLILSEGVKDVKKMDTTQNTLILSDCLEALRYWFTNNHLEFIDLGYIDPPFNSNKKYNILWDEKYGLSEQAFSDTWSTVDYKDQLLEINTLDPTLCRLLKNLKQTNIPKSYIAYLTNMSLTCWYYHKILKPTGSFYYHCDPTMSHYIKMILGRIFGVKNFRNEIVWHYQRGTKPKIMFGHKHDIIFFYTKTDNWNFNRQSQPVANPDRYDLVDKDGRKYLLGGTGMETKYYLDKGTTCDDVWSWRAEKRFDQINPMSKERLDYPTQKPEALLERIIKASSNPNDFVADFFMGGGTTVATAARLGRRFIGVDISPRSFQITEDRLKKMQKNFGREINPYNFSFTTQLIPKSAQALQNLITAKKLSHRYFQDHICKYYIKDIRIIPSKSRGADGGIDGEFGFEFEQKSRKGIVQITTSAASNHFGSFCNCVRENDLGVYISFYIPDTMREKAKGLGYIGNVNKLQILTVDDIITGKNKIKLPHIY